MWKSLRTLLGGSANRQEPTQSSAVAEAAERFVQWLRTQGQAEAAFDLPTIAALDSTLNRMRGHQPASAMPEALAADAASFLGEFVRRHWGAGEWVEHPAFGFVLAGAGGISHAKLLALPLVERKWKMGERFSLAEFVSALESRFAAERSLPADAVATPEDIARALSRLSGDDAQAAAGELSQRFREFWRSRYPAALPMTLLGVREVDGFLRSHYFINTLNDGRLVQAGFFLGEVGRGLFGGEWSFEGITDPARVALHYAELDYFPVGRVFKMMTSQPEGEPLDEYLRLIPSARMELRKRETGS